MTETNSQTDYKAALDAILAIDIDECEVQLCLASLGNNDAPDIQHVQVSDNVAGEFKEIAKEALTKRKKDSAKGDLVVKEYDPQAKPDRHEVECLDIATHDFIKAQLDGLSNVATLDVFQEDSNFVSNLRFYIIVLKPIADTPIYFFRAYTPKKELGRSALFAIVLKQGTYNRVEDCLFLFDQHLDCMVRGDNLFIFNKDKFQKIFQFYEMLRASARQTLQTIQQRIPIDDFAAFETACEGHLQKLSKLKNIASKPYLQTITMNDIKKVIGKYRLQIETVGLGSDEKIKFDASDKWAILRLLDDDYLESLMTGSSYEVNSKRSIP